MHPHKKHLLTSLVLSLIMILIIIFFVVVVFKVDLTELFGIKDFKNEQDDNKKENREKLDQTEEKTNKKDSSSGNLPIKTELI